MIFSILFAAYLCSFSGDAAIPTLENVVPAVLGSSVTLVCTIPQTNQLVWDHTYNNNQTIIALKGKIILPNSRNQSKFSVDVTGNTQSLIVHALTLQDDGVYKCWEVKNGQIKQLFKVNILVKPTRIELLPPPVGGIDEGSDQTLTCEADGGKPPPIIEWYILGPSRNRTTIPSAVSDTTYLNGTGLRRSQIVLSPVVKTLYKTSVLCVVELPYYFVANNTINLDVNLFPGIPVFKTFNGIFDDGQRKTITCESHGSRPAASLSWYMNDKKVTGTNTKVYKNSNGTFYVTSTITQTFDKSKDGSNLTCRAMNDVLKRQNRPPVQTTVVLRASYMPVLHAMNGSMDVYENSKLDLQCSVDARPMSLYNQVVWLKSGQNVIPDNRRVQTNYSTNHGQFNLHIHEVNRFDIGQYQCQASNRLGIGRSPPLALNVYYRPVCLTPSIEKHAVSIGQTVTLTCRVTANPSNATVTWRYKTRNRIIKDNQPSFTDPFIDRTSTSSIQIKVALNIDYTDIECLAKNNVGTMLQPCLYMIVKPGPPDIPKNCTHSLVGTSQLKIQCTAGFSGGGEQYFTLQQIQGQSFIQVKNHSEPKFEVADLLPGRNYSYRVCAASVTYRGTVGCTYIMSFKTQGRQNGPSQQDPIVAASTQDTTLYIVGGVVGFLVLLCLVIVISCFVKRRQQSADEREMTRGQIDVSSQPRDNSQFYVDFEKVAKLEEHVSKAFENQGHDHHEYKGSQQKANTKSNAGYEDVFMDGPVTSLQPFTLKALASTSHDTQDDQTDDGQGNVHGMHQTDKGINPDVIYTVPFKPKNNKKQCYQNTAFINDDVTDLDDSLRSKSKSTETLVSEGSRNELCYSEGDLKKALQSCSEQHDLSSVTKSLRRSCSLNKLDLNPPESDGNKTEQYSIYYDKNKHLSGTDAYVYMFPDAPKPETHSNDYKHRRTTYNIDDNADDADKHRSRRRSYNIAIMDDHRNSENIGRENNLEDDVFSHEGMQEVSVNDIQNEKDVNVNTNSDHWVVDKDLLHRNCEMLNGISTEIDNFSTEGFNGSDGSYNAVHCNNFNSHNQEDKTLKSKSMDDLERNKGEKNKSNGSTDVVAYF